MTETIACGTCGAPASYAGTDNCLRVYVCAAQHITRVAPPRKP